MNKQIVYRIEEKNAKKGLVYEGPYFNNYGGSSQWKERSHNNKKNNPTCDEDKTLSKNFNTFQKKSGNKFQNTDFYCGFTSLEQMKKWFTEKELWNLEMQGFVLTAYEVEVVVSSKKQALFIPKKGKKRQVLKFFP